MANSVFHLLVFVSLASPGQGADDTSSRFEAIPLPPVTREQLDTAFKSRFTKPNPNLWNRFFPSGQNGTGLNGSQIPALMKLLAGMTSGNGFDPTILQKLIGSMGERNSGFDPSLLKDLMAMSGKLEGQRATLEKAFPQIDWARFSELMAKFRTNPSMNDSVEMMKFLEQLRSGVGPLGNQDIASIESILQQFRTLQPNPAAALPGQSPHGFPGTLPTHMLPPDAMGRLTEFLQRLGLNQQQIAHVSDWLKAVPAPGLNGNLAEWVTKVDWARYSPGNWRAWSPTWAVSAFENLRPHLGFLRNLPSFRMPRLPSAQLPRLPMVALETPKTTWREALAWLLMLAVAVLAGACLIYKQQISDWLRRPIALQTQTTMNVADIHSLVQLFEMEAMKRLGPQARYRNIRRIEADLLNCLPADNQRQAVRLLTALYERWRYLPHAWHPLPREIHDGQVALSLLRTGHKS